MELLGTAALRTEPASRRAGSPRARAWLPLLDPRSGSPAETIACLRLHDAGLRPVAQAALRSASGRTLRPDFLFRAQGLVVEVEGYAFHGTREAHASDLGRFNELQSCPEGPRVLRFTATEVFRDPDRFVAEVRAALAELGRLTSVHQGALPATMRSVFGTPSSDGLTDRPRGGGSALSARM
ncbi:endonuclease domain-containing protein [[Kitasatospora] papulosa]|uniref:endonuclease domain-containing protein n=1 Tax=[Kitasatospora] papulosa TaxID=1464011 RepID=UPI00369DBAF1